MIKVYIINGLAQSGKSTFCSMTAEYLHNYHEHILHVYEMSSIDKVKEIARNCGWDGIKDASSRIFLYKLKEAIDNYSDYIYEDLIESIKKFSHISPERCHIYFVNIREPKNIEKFKTLCIANDLDVSTILVTRYTTSIEEVPEIIEGIENYSYDHIIYNVDSLNTLKSSAIRFANQVILTGVIDNPPLHIESYTDLLGEYKFK